MIRSIAAVAIMLAAPVSAIAQSYQVYDSGQSADQKVSLGLTIPIGRGGAAHERKPRLELGFDHRTRNRSVEVVGTELNTLKNQKARIGLSLSKEPQLMLNGREVPKTAGSYNMSTAVWVGIGLVAAAGVGVLVMWQIAEANTSQSD